MVFFPYPFSRYTRKMAHSLSKSIQQPCMVWMKVLFLSSFFFLPHSDQRSDELMSWESVCYLSIVYPPVHPQFTQKAFLFQFKIELDSNGFDDSSNHSSQFLFLEISKFQILWAIWSFSGESVSLEIKLNDNVILCVIKTKTLGVYVDKALSWCDHIQKTCSEIIRNLYLLQQMKIPLWMLTRDSVKPDELFIITSLLSLL